MWTTLRRALQGKSPFRPDRAHFHHKLLDAGFGVRGAFFILAIIGTALALVGIAIEVFEVPDAISFALWLVSGLSMILLMHHARVLWYVLPRKLRRVHTVEA
jgi:hypothetical protein